MNTLEPTPSMVTKLEALMLEKFKTEPFHNLHLLYDSSAQQILPGGTCSDKTLSFLDAASKAGFDVALHSGFIDGREIHRLVRATIGGRRYFADVGNGWPALKLYPADRETSFRCFGMSFRTAIEGQRVLVFHDKRGRESLQLEIDVNGKPEYEILADIQRRFSSDITYPFSNGVRFSLVVGPRFLFLRGDRLEVYEESNFRTVEGIGPDDLPGVIHRYFGYDVQRFFSDAPERPLTA